jgi:hypothetical protein
MGQPECLDFEELVCTNAQLFFCTCMVLAFFFIKRKVMSDMESREFVNVKDLPLYCIHSNEFVIFYCVF